MGIQKTILITMFKTVAAAICVSTAMAGFRQHQPVYKPAPKKESYPKPVYARGPRDFEAGKDLRGLKNFEKNLDIRNKKELNLGLGEIEQNGDIDFNLDFERRGDFEAKGPRRAGGFNSYGIHRQAPGPIVGKGVIGAGVGVNANFGGASDRQATANYGGSGGKGGLVDIGNKFDTRSI